MHGNLPWPVEVLVAAFKALEWIVDHWAVLGVVAVCAVIVLRRKRRR